MGGIYSAKGCLKKQKDVSSDYKPGILLIYKSTETCENQRNAAGAYQWI
jgi:hypothetical protein